MSDTLRPGERLVANNSEFRVSNNGSYKLVMQQDGNLVLYKGNTPLWASNTDGVAVDFCIMQDDGNLVLYGFASNAVWASNTNGQPGSFLVVQDDGNVVIYRPNFPVWATNTNQ